MELSLCLIMRQKLVLRLLLINVFIANHIYFVSAEKPSCHDEERSALLQFKDSFVINQSASSFEGAYPKFLQWKSNNCCLWDGINCDAKAGHVIALHLSSSCLFGSINSNSTLFSLIHLQILSLSDNHFNFSQIPTAIGQLSHLTYLNLSSSAFYGQVPLEISDLNKLSSLEMSYNYDPVTEEKFLQLKDPNFKTLVRNLTRLEILILNFVDMSSEVPHSLANFSSLTTLILKDCELYGDFPEKIFQLPNLQILSVRYNEYLTGRLPEFQKRSPLIELMLKGPIPFSLGKLTQLTYLNLGNNNFKGGVPSSLRNLAHLTLFSVGKNQLTGPIPPWLGNLTKLTSLDLQKNLLHGPVPQSLAMLVNLQTLYINNNNLGGNLKFDMFLNMKSLTRLQLGDNNLSLIFGEASKNATDSKFKLLDLSSCNLRKFPHFLKHQNELEWLVLSRNNIDGQLPNWMLNISINTLLTLSIPSNLLAGFNQLPVVPPWVNLCQFDISFNMLQGPLPIPPPSIVDYDASNNMLAGEISPVVCNMSSLNNLDLSNNNLGGIIPPCLGNSASPLVMLSLRNNSLHGIIPEICSNNMSKLKMIDVSDNRLQGELPRSLSKCLMLEAIVVSNNQFHDTFPSWLGSLSFLKLLMLRDNGFYGVIGKPEKDIDFSNLRVLDLSSNSFSGELPSQYIFNWNAMKSIKPIGLRYMSANWSSTFSNDYQYSNGLRYKITIMYKGVPTHYDAIQDVFAFIDLSDNRFEGKISDLFGSLKALRSLNLSNNMLTGCIPSSLGYLTELESLDHSRNSLSYHIPQQLKQLGILSSFNVSHNNLTGPIPQGNQFSVFDNSSFYGNLELCGDPFSKKCGNSQSSPPLEEDHEDSKSILKKYWIFILAGYISGLVVGVVLADIAITRKPGWFHWCFVDLPSSSFYSSSSGVEGNLNLCQIIARMIDGKCLRREMTLDPGEIEYDRVEDVDISADEEIIGSIASSSQ
ncbi:receptor-like protein 7 [Ziziphus jujuba]|uniref:Receptor-like protein 7 n=1 Tax=Ziziphus jujuba TaxID=326968 RepID=A0ABM4AGA7_ZIZJJ|nr:receptor-like protein 7 [Ziziphus jujuba]